MIVFDLRCASGHVFEGWFASSVDFDDQQERGMVSCPVCGSVGVEKAPMAPRLAGSAESESPLSPGEAKKLLGEMAGLQKRLLATSDFVGDRFPDEARAIHLGEAEARSIHGRASRSEAESLREEGISVSPLPFPVIEPGEEN